MICTLDKLAPEKMHHVVFIAIIVVYSLFFYINFSKSLLITTDYKVKASMNEEIH